VHCPNRMCGSVAVRLSE